METLKLGSLFDGSGGFPLAGVLCGITPLWASEIEPYPIAVTKSRFPEMKHLGDITNINGSEIEPVDIITFGSPCQDLSVAGKRAGLKHENNGDDETTRSGLFMEAVRIIKEMRKKTNGEYPRYAVWENVPGAFSSNNGEDFRIVLEELIKIIEPNAVMPAVPCFGWPYADCYSGNGWSLAYRVLDAQFWGVPQRRRRIYLVADFGGERAREILFEREGLRGYFTQGRTPQKTTSADAERSAGGCDICGNHIIGTFQNTGRGWWNESPVAATVRTPCGGDSVLANVAVETLLPTSRDVTPDVIEKIAWGFPLGFRPENVRCYEETATTLCNGTRAGFCNGVVIKTWDARGNGDGDTANTITGDHENRITDYSSIVCIATQQGGAEIRTDGKAPPVTAAAGMSGNNTPVVVEALDVYNQALSRDVFKTLSRAATDSDHIPCVVINSTKKNKTRYIIRRLMPTECARLQGFPDTWGHPDSKETITDEEYIFWLDVRNTHAAINGRATKEYTKDQILKWYNKLHTDSAEYKMWGNGIALPTALYVMQGIANTQ